jgi:hypothetical protein
MSVRQQQNTAITFTLIIHPILQRLVLATTTLENLSLLVWTVQGSLHMALDETAEY